MFTPLGQEFEAPPIKGLESVSPPRGPVTCSDQQNMVPVRVASSELDSSGRVCFWALSQTPTSATKMNPSLSAWRVTAHVRMSGVNPAVLAETSDRVQPASAKPATADQSADLSIKAR